MSIVFLTFKIEEVGFTAKETLISCPVDIPPSIQPALFEVNFILPLEDLDDFINRDTVNGIDDRSGSMALLFSIEYVTLLGEF